MDRILDFPKDLQYIPGCFITWLAFPLDQIPSLGP